MRLKRLNWSWSDGIMLEDMDIANNPGFSSPPGSMLTMKRARLVVNWADIIKRKAAFDLTVEGFHIRLIRRADGKTNLDALLAAPGPEKTSKEKARDSDWRKLAVALPAEIRGRVRVKDVSLDVDDRMGNHRLAVRKGFIDLKAPSLGSEPVILTAGMEGEVDGRPIPPVNLFIRIENLGGADGRLRPANAVIHVAADLPGLRIKVDGSLTDMGVAAQADLDLAELLAVTRPFVPSVLPDLKGKVRLALKLSGDPETAMAFDMTVEGDGVAASGGSIKEKSVGPFHFATSHRGRIRLTDGLVGVEEGRIQVQEKSRISWNGHLEGFNRENPSATMEITSLALDAGELLQLAPGFLPETLSLETNVDRERPFQLTAERIALAGRLPAGPFNVSLTGLSVAAPGIRVHSDGQVLSVEGLHALVDRGEIALSDHFPTRAEVAATISIDRIGVNGNQPMHMAGLRVSRLRLTAENMVRNTDAMFGLCGELRFENALGLEDLVIPGKAQMKNIGQSVRGWCVLGPEPPVRAGVDAFSLSSPSLKLEPGFQGGLKTGVDIRAGITAVRLLGMSPLRMDVEGARADIELGDLLRARVNVFARDLGSKSLNTEGSVHVKLAGLMPLAAAYLPPKTRIRGNATARWKFAGRLPRPNEQQALISKPPDYLEIVEQSQFIKNLQLSLELNRLNVRLPIKGAGGIKANGIETERPVVLTLKDGLEQMSLEGEIRIGKVLSLPSMGELPVAMPVRLSFSANQQGLKRAHLTERMVIGPPYRVTQDLKLTVEGIDKLLDGPMPPPAAAVLNRLNGELAASLHMTPGSGLEALTVQVVAKGEMKGGVHLGLTAGKRLVTSLWLDSPGLDLSRGEDFRLEDLKTSVRIDKRYRIVQKGPEAQTDTRPISRLSREVVADRASDRFVDRRRKDVSRRLKDDLRGKLSGERSVRMGLLAVKTGDLAFSIKHPEMQLSLDDGLPAADHFQMDTLGGTIQGDLAVVREGDAFQVIAGCAFSGLRADELISELKGELSPEEAELSGSLRAHIPLSENAQRVLEGLQLNVNLSHIGSKALERFLYALDPQEGNESIVRQRELLRIGTPRWIALDIRYGALSLTGEIEAKGVRLDLPQIQRLNIANLPLQRDLERYVTRLGPVLETLRVLSADTIEL
ncbi:MAG: hypothetical protein JRF65_09350, partial [Deltaproteobacteria bacterium]|nr:hypothetical protein [Deltaproteobacteria bacterium]